MAYELWKTGSINSTNAKGVFYQYRTRLSGYFDVYVVTNVGTTLVESASIAKSEFNFNRYRYKIELKEYPDYTRYIFDSLPSVTTELFRENDLVDRLSSPQVFEIYRELKNSAPTITPITTPSGTYTTKPTFNYTVADADANTMIITEKIDGIVFNTRTAVASGTTFTYTPSDLAWLRTRINQTVNIEITADDGNGGVTTVTYPITRTTPAIDFQLKTPFETDVAARRILLMIEGKIPSGAILNVQASNNAFDISPTWENATNLVVNGLPYPFNNKTKTASRWGVSFKVRVERNGVTEEIYINGIGGSYD